MRGANPVAPNLGSPPVFEALRDEDGEDGNCVYRCLNNFKYSIIMIYKYAIIVFFDDDDDDNDDEHFCGLDHLGSSPINMGQVT